LPFTPFIALFKNLTIVHTAYSVRAFARRSKILTIDHTTKFVRAAARRSKTLNHISKFKNFD